MTTLTESSQALIERTGKTVSYFDRSGSSNTSVKVTPPAGYRDDYIDGDLIKYGDLNVAVAELSLGFEAEVSDEITVDGVIWLVEEVDNIWKDDGHLLYDMQIRKYGNTAITPSSLWTKLDKKMVNVAFDIINRKGVDAVFHASSDYVRKVVTAPDFDSKLVEGDVVQAGDIRIYLPTKNLLFAPKAGMMVTYGFDKWLIAGERPVYSGEQICQYELHLRR